MGAPKRQIIAMDPVAHRLPHRRPRSLLLLYHLRRHHRAVPRMLPDQPMSLGTYIILQKSTHKKRLKQPTKRSLSSQLTCLPHRKQLRMRRDHKHPSLHQRLRRHREHWVTMAILRQLLFIGYMAPGLGIIISDTIFMHLMDVPTPLDHNPVNNSLLSRCRRTLAMHESRVLTSHLPLRCSMATAPPIYLHPPVQKPLDPSRPIQQLRRVCHSPHRRPILLPLLELHFHDRRLPHHQVLHLALATEPLACLLKYRATLFRLHQKRTVRRRSLHEPWIGELCHLQECQNVGTRCSQEYPPLPREQRNGTNGVDRVFLR